MTCFIYEIIYYKSCFITKRSLECQVWVPKDLIAQVVEISVLYGNEHCSFFGLLQMNETRARFDILQTSLWTSVWALSRNWTYAFGRGVQDPYTPYLMKR